MGDEEGKTDGEAKESDKFDPKSLSDEAQEYIRRQVQSESDSKTQLAETKLRAEVAQANRSAVETAEQNELRQLAKTGQHEALGQRYAARLEEQDVETKAISRASEFIEREMVNKFSETLSPERVEQIKREVVNTGGAHAEFAAALAKEEGGDSRAEEIKAEVKAQMLEAGVKVRDDAGGADKVADKGQGTKLSTFEEVQAAYVAGTLPGGRKAYKEAMEANQEGR